MSGFIETERLTLEEIEVIEEALAQRIRRDPALVPPLIAGAHKMAARKRPHSERLAQQHEMKFLVQRVRDRCSSLAVSRRDAAVPAAELAALADPHYTFAAFDAALARVRHRHQHSSSDAVEDLGAMYAMFPTEGPRAKRAKRKHVLSMAASHIDLGAMFSAEEECGRSLDLGAFHQRYCQVSAEVPLVAFYLTYDKFPYTVIAHHGQYTAYLRELAQYLTLFVKRAHPLEEAVLARAEAAASAEAAPVADGSTNDAGEWFCLACNKWFAKESVYKGHLSGKRHKRAAANPNVAGSADVVPGLERQIAALASFLEPERQNAIARVERQATMTERERMLEAAVLRDEGSEFTDVDSSDEESDASSSDDDDNAFKNLPVGADGLPMPFWLYKLQGYHKTYNCEICGDATYKGRMVFTKHFAGAKHQQGLKMLGVSDDLIPLFRNITSIDEAVELWRKVKRDQRARAGDTENAIEVEDADGNVMSKKDYEELKRQGLL